MAGAIRWWSYGRPPYPGGRDRHKDPSPPSPLQRLSAVPLASSAADPKALGWRGVACRDHEGSGGRG
eukprot:CAMPEP_0175335642 /NCGR_PEP_ID=MMETSP0095-20121207/3400_1 /TAXON_ID=311494 /ORGANISM="Alexandrium monilatum, Strain CCMP3105" /LENGTH=66 /DNA_ID=CAMNT_0016632971 /DNA_START=184 /DNA_END=380 /DNA_ORIENTATION=-